MSISDAPSDSTFEPGDRIFVTVTFSKAVDVTGSLRVRVGVGSRLVNAWYRETLSTTTALVFRMTVAQGNPDTDGISIGASALQTVGGGTIREAGTTTDAVLSLGLHAISNSAAHKVGTTYSASRVKSVTVTSRPSEANTYLLGDTIEVTVSFLRRIFVTGAPQLALGIGAQTRQAAYVDTDAATETRIRFRYVVATTDADTDGISVGSGALTLNGGTIIDGRGILLAPSLVLGSNTFANAASHRVDGSRGPPRVSAVTIGAPAVGDTFERGETIDVTVMFNKTAAVTGTPQLALTIGSTTRQAAYASGGGTASLVFRYVVVAADTDADGISIGSSALALNGGTIKEVGGTTNAVLGLGTHAIANSTNHKVAGGTFTASAASGVTISSTPAADSTYGRTERIEVDVAFSRPVTVTGAP